MGKKTWGPACWRWLHNVAWTSTLDTDPERKEAHTFVLHFAAHLPCSLCREHFYDMLRKDGTIAGATADAFKNETAFRYATVQWHNRVNERLRKPLMSYEDAEAMYGTRYGKEKRASPSTRNPFMVVSGCFLLYMVYRAVLKKGERRPTENLPK